MHLAHSRIDGQVVPVVRRDGRWHDLRPLVPAITPEVLAPEFLGRIRGADLPVVDEPAEFGPPLAGIGKIVCIGLNYADHAAETGAEPPAEPIVFMKAPDTVVGPTDDVLVPRRSVKTDYELELAVVIGSTARYLTAPEEADGHIAGYTISNDVSEREFQLERGGQWDKGKNCETFNPLGPWIATADEIADPQQLTGRLRVNGELRQDGTTKNMIFGVRVLVHYLSQFMTLHPGDVINTGTPAGVAMAHGGKFLRAGDVVELEIDGLGSQRQTMRDA